MWHRCRASPRCKPWLKSTISSISSPTAPYARIVQIIARAFAAEPQLEGRESSFVAQFDRFGCHSFRLLKPQTVAVVRFHGPPTAEQDAKRHATAFARASQAAMSSPDTAIMESP